MTKRCKNCGWPNDDSCVKCQKCNAALDNVPTAPSSARETAYEPAGGYQPTSTSDGENLRKTVSENQFFGSALNGGKPMESSQQGSPNIPLAHECPNCHYQLREGVGICPNCGTSINAPSVDDNKKCPHCGNMNPSQSVYCNHCGKELNVEVSSMNSDHGGNKPERMGTVNPWMQPNSGTFCTLKPIAWEGENVNYQPLSFSGSVISLNRSNTDPNNQSITSAVQAELTWEDGEWYIVDKSAMHTTYVMASRKMKLKKGDTIILGNRLFEFN